MYPTTTTTAVTTSKLSSFSYSAYGTGLATTAIATPTAAAPLFPAAKVSAILGTGFTGYGNLTETASSIAQVQSSVSGAALSKADVAGATSISSYLSVSAAPPVTAPQFASISQDYSKLISSVVTPSQTPATVSTYSYSNTTTLGGYSTLGTASRSTASNLVGQQTQGQQKANQASAEQKKAPVFRNAGVPASVSLATQQSSESFPARGSLSGRGTTLIRGTAPTRGTVATRVASSAIGTPPTRGTATARGSPLTRGTPPT